MKHIKTIIPAVGALILGFSACDNIADDERYIPVERQEAEKNVLVFEFTGQMCSNCPDGAEVMTGLMDSYPDHVFTIGLSPHNTAYTIVPPQYDLGLTSDLATEYYNYYKPDAFPAAVVDGGGLNKNYTTWGADVTAALSGSSPANLNLASNYDPDSRLLTIDYQAVFTDVYNSELRVLALITESNIVGFQLSTHGVILDYTHKHILRDSMNGMWGTELGGIEEGASGYIPGQEVDGQLTMTLPEAWNAENCAVICVLVSPDNRFLQTEEIHVINH